MEFISKHYEKIGISPKNWNLELWKTGKNNTEYVSFKNHQRYSLRCFSKGMTLVSLKLKNFRTLEPTKVIASYLELKNSFLNERTRNIFNTRDHYEQERYIYSQNVTSILGPELSKECDSFIKDIKEARHLRVF